MPPGEHDAAQAPARSRPALVPKPGQKFKIWQLADAHLGEDPGGSWGPEQDAKTIKVIEAVLDQEN